MSLLRFSLDDPSSITSLGITLMLMLMGFIYYYFYSNSSSSEPKIMVSTATSSIQNSFKYDVFISFRGEDIRKTFVGHLYQALKDKGIYTYKDDLKILRGKRISDDLFRSIKDSRFYIIVFSKDYASSSWCLEELVKIMECHKMPGHTAYPVFYDVEPTEVRNQSGAVGDAFSKHENQEAAGKWREALNGAADLAGWELKNTLDGHEAKFIKKIVHEISLQLRPINFGFDEKLVGMETRVKDVVSSLKPGTDEVRMIGIKGMGGIGKTTTARAVFDHLSIDFEAKSFVGNVREVSNDSVSGLKKLQEQVLSRLLNEQVTLNSVVDGVNMMKKRMCGKKFLLVLDDVDHIDQLKALAGDPKWFKPGSRILITTRDEQVLVAHRVNVIRDVVLLSEQEAISLFSRYAFGRENPLPGFEELSGKVVRYAAGLPLTLKVLGSFLHGKDMLEWVDEWVDVIERLKEIPLGETLKQLELSYNSLEDDYREIFLDIACILKGQHKQKAIRILESCGFHARIGLKVLEQSSLITISKCEVLGMHDHIEEMGKNIVRRSHPDAPNRHSRLWIAEEIEDIFVNEKGTGATRCLKLDMSRENSRIVMKGLRKMKKLRYLEVNYADYDSESDYKSDGECLGSDPEFDDSTQYFPDSLQYLKISYYPFLYLPRTFQANNLVGLEMESSRRMVQLWEEGEKKVLKKLRFLSLDIKKLTTFDLKMTPNLEMLYMDCSVFRAGQAMGKRIMDKRLLLQHEAKKWKGALKEAAGMARLQLKNTLDGHEAKFIKKNVHEMSLELDFGFDSRVKDVVSSLEDGINEVRMIGIKGMGGAGKTTLARAVFDHISADFEAISFVENVREVSKPYMIGSKNLQILQEQVLSDVLNEQVTLNSVDDGKNMMKRRMCGIKVLLVLDDVDHMDQLKALAGDPKWFKPGSRILITTRDEQVLMSHGVKFIRDIDLLSEQEAITLFSRYAFGRENPLQGYEQLSGKVVRYAAGLPLTLKELGSFLRGKDMLEWVDAIDRLKRIPLKVTLKNLELSYISLEEDYKEIFLDIACILKGQTKEDAIRVLECCGVHATNGLKVLERRSLITVDEDGELGMHNLIEEMGKNIVRRCRPDEPNKHSRLWIDEEIEDMLANNMGTQATRCLKLTESNRNARIVMKGLGKMKELRYLEVTFAYYNAECLDDTSQYFPNSLRYIKCKNYPFLYLPKTFQANNLVGLEMESSRRMVQLWEEGEKKILNKLKFLSLSGSNLTIFDLRITPNLVTLSLNYSLNLKELCMPASCQKLNYLQISRSKLRTFDLGLTPNLESLSLEDCVDFEELHVSVACPYLKFLNLSSSRLRSLDLELIPNLESLDLRRCHELVEINAPVGCLKKVVRLNLSGCELLEKLPEDIGRSECLKELDITDTGISHLPQSIFGLKGLLIASTVV